MADIYFTCSCAKNLAVDESGVGMLVRCPDCGEQIEVPEPEVAWIHLACGNKMTAPASMSGRLVQCLQCGKNAFVPAKKIEVEQREGLAVPRLARWGNPPPKPVRTRERLGLASI